MAKDVNGEKFADIMNKVPDNATISSLAELFKMFGDPTRAKILSILQVRAMYVGELADILGMSDSAISHQLRVLRAAKLVKGKKETFPAVDENGALAVFPPAAQYVFRCERAHLHTGSIFRFRPHEHRLRRFEHLAGREAVIEQVIVDSRKQPHTAQRRKIEYLAVIARINEIKGIIFALFKARYDFDGSFGIFRCYALHGFRPLERRPNCLNHME